MIEVMRESGFDLMGGENGSRGSQNLVSERVEEVYIEREMGGKWV